MSSIMRARNGLTGLGEVSEVIGALSRAEGCWTFDARDRVPRPSRATAHHPNKNLPTVSCPPPARAGSFFVRNLAVQPRLSEGPLIPQLSQSHADREGLLWGMKT